MNEVRLIDANALKYKNLAEVNGRLTYVLTAEEIDNAPTVEYTFEEAFQKTVCEQRLYCPQRPQGEWIKQYGKSYELKTNEGIFVGEFTKCPKCQYDKARGSNFCPNCGASMKKGGAK